MKFKHSYLVFALIISIGGIVLLLRFFYAVGNQPGESLVQVEAAPLASPSPRTQADRVATVQADFTATAQAAPPPTATSDQPSPTPPGEYLSFISRDLGFGLEYPGGWQAKVEEELAIFSPSEAGLAPGQVADFAVWVGKSPGTVVVAHILGKRSISYPAGNETIKGGSLTLDDQFWTAVESRFVDEASGEPVRGIFALTMKDGQHYYLAAAAPEARWESLQPRLQIILNSFRFVE